MKTGKIRKFFGRFAFPQRRKRKHGGIKTEKCILCGKDTGIPFDEPIKSRTYFVAGCGQLCENCFDSLQYESISKNKLSDEYLDMLLSMTIKNSKEHAYEEST